MKESCYSEVECPDSPDNSPPPRVPIVQVLVGRFMVQRTETVIWELI